MHLKRNITLLKLISLFILLLAPVVVSYNETHIRSEESLWIASNPAPDLNLEVAIEVANGYNGVSYFNDFMFRSTYINDFVVFVMIFSLLFIGTNVARDLVEANGNNIIVRTSFKNYLKDNIKAQLIFNFGVVLLFFNVVFLITCLVVGNYDFSNTTASFYLKGAEFFWQHWLVVNAQALHVSVITSMITIFSTLLVYFIKSKYFILIFPFLYVSLTNLFTYTVGNFIKPIGVVSQEFILKKQLTVLGSIVEGYLVNINGYIFFITVFIALNIILYKAVINKYGKDYIA